MVGQVTGLGVKKELTISLEELKTKFKKHEVVSGFYYSDHSITLKDCGRYSMRRKQKEGDEGCEALKRS